MPYVIIARDKPNSLELRAKLRPEHLEYLERHKASLMAAGGLLEDDGSGGTGSVLIVETDDRAQAEAFAAGDPFNRGGLFASVEVVRWRKAFFAGERFI